MDFINVEHLSKYRELLDQISAECAEQERLKKRIEEENNKIIILNLTRQKETKHKVFFVKVKLFSSIFDVHALYGDEIDYGTLENMSRYKNCKYYLVEMYVQKTFYAKMCDQSWILNICVKNGCQQVCKSVPIKKKLTYPIYEIIPFAGATQGSSVEVSLLLPSGGTHTYLQLDKIDVDISYHFDRVKRDIRRLSFHDKVFNLAKYHGERYDSLKLIKSSQILRYGFACRCTKESFVEACMKNSYHRLKAESFLDLISDGNISLEITNEGDKIIIIYNQEKSSLKLQAGLEDVHKIKLYFINEFCKGTIGLDKKILPELINLEFYLHTEMSDEKVLDIYKAVRDLFHRLPI